MRTIGAADEFWRLRLTRLDVADSLDFEWRDDILYREPRDSDVEVVATWCVEAVSLDDVDTVVRIADFELREEAEAFFSRANEDMREMTKTQFEDSYLSGDDDADSSSED